MIYKKNFLKKIFNNIKKSKLKTFTNYIKKNFFNLSFFCIFKFLKIINSLSSKLYKKNRVSNLKIKLFFFFKKLMFF